MNPVFFSVQKSLRLSILHSSLNFGLSLFSMMTQSTIADMKQHLKWLEIFSTNGYEVIPLKSQPAKQLPLSLR